VEDESHPFLLRVQSGEGFLRVRVYIWNVTHGGGHARAADEYRIQVTGVEEFSNRGVDRALILGWWEEGGVFAAWDISKHLGAFGASPSLQILEGSLREGAVSRVFAQQKGNDEIAVAFIPSFLGDYVEGQPSIHGFAASPVDLAAFRGVIAHPEDAQEAVASGTSEPRRIILAQVARKLRDASFSDRVLRAYGQSCAMCGVQLRLIDAAHIVPAASSNDDSTSNGLALCALHHRAFDRALVSIDEKFRVVLNPDRIATLADENRLGGFPSFRKNLRAIIALPPATRDRPHPDLVREGNRVRGWRKFKRVA
jgi:putative restriction endonuclease